MEPGSHPDSLAESLHTAHSVAGYRGDPVALCEWGVPLSFLLGGMYWMLSVSSLSVPAFNGNLTCSRGTFGLSTKVVFFRL